MAFNFGSQNPAPAPAGGGFNFGSGATQPPPAPGNPAPSVTLGSASSNTPAPSNNPPAPAGTPAPSFAFGSTAANTPAPTGTTSTGGGFGAASTTTAAPSAGGFGASSPAAPSGGGFTSGSSTPGPSNAPAPSAGSCNFGGSSTSAPAPFTGGFGAPNPAPAPGGSSFSGAPTPAPGGFSLTGGSSTGSTPATGPKGLEVPAFHKAFPNDKIYSDVKQLLLRSSHPTEEGREKASDLIELLKCDGSNESSIGRVLANPKPLQYTGPDNNIRNQLQTNPQVVLSGNVEAILLPEMLKEVASIADDLRISEKEALSLYAEASKTATRSMLEEKLDESIIDQAKSADETLRSSPIYFGTNVIKAAKELYYFERQRLLRTILMLVQSRIEAPQHPWGNLIIQATDSLLQNNLIKNLIDLIREWSNIIKNIEQELAKNEAAQANSFSGLPKGGKFHFDQVHLAYALKERHSAAECLFFIAYHTQYTGQEVAALIDVIRDLTNGAKSANNGLPVLNPFQDVPSPYEDRPHADQAWAQFHSSLPPMKERSHLEWEKELVKKTCKSSKPRLLHCVSALIMTAISALDAKQVLFDRNTHKENSIGMGNELFPPGGYSTTALEPIHHKLTLDGCKEWERSDIWGLLAAAYALLLSSSPSLVSSPRQGSASPSRPQGSIEVRRAFRDCLEAPTALKSITFAKLSLLPVLRQPSQYPESKCDSSEFFLSVMSEFVSKYLEILSGSSLPPSRKNWQTEKEEGLQLERENQKQKAEFRLWVGQYDQQPKEDSVPSTVDLMKRPDCMDDIIALATALADLGPEYARKFWDVINELDEDGSPKVVLKPSRALTTIENASAQDDSLLHFYLAFLGVLAKAEDPGLCSDGATVVNGLLSDTSSSKLWNWSYIFETIRWYVRQFNDFKTSNAANSGSSGSNSTSYYYRNINLSSNAQQSIQSTANSKPAELGDTNTFYLLSLLNLISNVASKSAASRLQILAMQLPITAENSNAVVGSDTTLNILFSLATAPIQPEIRGLTFTALASLLRNESLLSQEDCAKMRDFSQKAWELVESCQVLPILLLDQYPHSAGEEVLRNITGLRFPVSSTSLAGSSASPSWVPVDQHYAILYEMEHVESHKGHYNSTEGFLRLLGALFSNSCPTDLGRNWRLRSGCTPYIEYVIHFVLPRATGSVSRMGKLPFRTKGDQARLVALALEVVESVLVRYSFKIQNQPEIAFPTSKGALELLRQGALVDKVVVGEGHGDCQDFENKPVRPLENNTQAERSGIQNSTLQAMPFAMSVPAAKSPGFVVLADLLSASDGDILKTIALLLGEGVAASSALGAEASKLANTYALFGETPPTTTSSKHVGSDERNPSSLRATLLKALRPYSDSLSYSEAVYWRERGVSRALQVLCASAVREEAFYGAVNAVTNPLRIVPVLRFETKSPYASQITGYNAHLLRLKDLMLASWVVLSSIIEYIGYAGSSDEHDVHISTSGLSLIHFVHQSLAGPRSIQALCGGSGGQHLSLAIARRLLVSFEHTDSDPHFQILSLIFDWILSDLRSGGTSGLSHTLLGFLGEGANPTWSGSTLGSQDSFGAILELLTNVRFVVESKTAGFAASCFEILARACDLNNVYDRTSLYRAIHSTERLHSIGFWSKKLRFFLENRGINEPSILESAVATGNEQVLHSIAWVLKGVASELHALMGHCPEEGRAGLVGYLAPKFGECQKVLSLLFGAHGHLLENVILHLPVERTPIDNSARLPPQDAIRLAIQILSGSPDIVDGYLVIDEEILLSSLMESDKAHKEEYQRWISSWNKAVKLDCAASHLSGSVRVLLGVALECFSKSRNQRADELVTMLAVLLNRLTNVPSRSELSATASQNLGWVAFLLSRVVAAFAVDSRTGIADLRNIRDLLARAIVSSGRQVGGVEGVRHNERTAILSVALLEVMEALPQLEADIDHRLFLDVALVLAQLSSVTEAGQTQPAGARQPSGASSVAPTEAAIIARSSLVTLVGIWDEDVRAPVNSLAYAILTHPGSHGTNERFIEVFIRLLKSFDEGAVVFLEKFAQIPFVGNLLLESGLVTALSTVADTYMQEEQRLQSLEESRSQKMTVGFPLFLKKHLELLGTLMATSHLLSEEHRHELPKNVISILGRYDQVFSRLFATFPSNGYELFFLIQTVAQVSLLCDATRGTVVSENPLQPIPNARVPLRDSGCERAIVSLSLGIAEHPLPADRLSKMPSSLAKTKDASSSLVEVSAGKGRSWWNYDNLVQEKSLPPSDFGDWTDAMFERAVLGAGILHTGLALLMKLPLQDFAREMSIVRGLFQISEAAMTIDTQVSALDKYIPQVDLDTAMDTRSEDENLPLRQRLDLLKDLGKKLGKNGLKLLLSIVQRVKSFMLESENRMKWSIAEKEHYCKAIGDTLDMTELETQGVGCTGPDDRELAKQLAGALRKDLATI